jgi:hypothetical protein
VREADEVVHGPGCRLRIVPDVTQLHLLGEYVALPGHLLILVAAAVLQGDAHRQAGLILVYDGAFDPGVLLVAHPHLDADLHAAYVS